MPAETPIDEVVDLVSTLIRFDTTNTGELETTKGEAECARWVAEQLEEVGYETDYLESGAPGPRQCVRPAAGRRQLARRAADARPPRRGARRAGRVERAPVLRRGRGRLRLGPRRGRHEGHGRHDDRRSPATSSAPASSRRAIWCSPSWPTRRHGGKYGVAVAGRQPARPVRGRHRGDRGGRRVLADRAAPRRRRTAALPDRDRGEGHALDAADRARPAGARLDGPRPQRRHRGRRGGRPAGPPPLPAGADRQRRAVPDGRRRGDRIHLRHRFAGPGRGRRETRARSPAS